MTPKQCLAKLAGARLDLLEKAPGDMTRFTTMGGVLISTALVAGFSAFFALHTVLGLSWQVCVAVGLGWSILILNLDRMLVVSMGGAGSARRSLLIAVPRLALAVVIGTVISTPLVLQIFDKEIQAEMTTMKAEAIEASKAALDNTYASIADLEKQERALLDIIEGRSVAAVADDPDVKAAQDAFDTAEATYQKAEQAAQCELDGTCGTGVPGQGDSYRQKQAAADSARSARDTAKQHLDETISEASQRIESGSATAVGQAKEKLPGVQADLGTEKDRKRQLEKEATDAQQGNTGLLARLEALDRLTSGHAMGQLTHLMLFLLFLCIEVLPVLVKLLGSFAPPSLYDRLAVRQDDDTEQVENDRSDGERALANQREATRLALEQQRLDAQIHIGQQATDEIARKQTRIVLDAVALWGELAKRRSDEELQRWMDVNAPATPVPIARNGTQQPTNGSHI
jgi:hypothetical protein